MNQVVDYMLHLVSERKRIIRELEEHGAVFTSLTEQEISDLRLENAVVVSSDLLGSHVSTEASSDTNGTST